VKSLNDEGVAYSPISSLFHMGYENKPLVFLPQGARLNGGLNPSRIPGHVLLAARVAAYS